MEGWSLLEERLKKLNIGEVSEVPSLTWIEPVEVLQQLMKNPRLQKPGAFAYEPEFVQDSEGNLQNVNPCLGVHWRMIESARSSGTT
eukprot:1819519-Rhodomonas_salina.1